MCTARTKSVSAQGTDTPTNLLAIYYTASALRAKGRSASVAGLGSLTSSFARLLYPLEVAASVALVNPVCGLLAQCADSYLK
jgi:hypothetical protein